MPKHWIAMSGSHGCLPDYCDVFPGTLEGLFQAQDSLNTLFDLTGEQRVLLKARLYIGEGLEGADYCQITECNCSTPWVHSDDQTAADWGGRE